MPTPAKQNPQHPKWGGRKAGIPNKATIEKRIAAAKALDEARFGTGKPLAKERLEELGEVAFAAMRAHQPVSEEMAKRARAAGDEKAKPQRGSWQGFGAWWDRAAYAYKELAKYQSPQLRAIAVAPAPEQTHEDGPKTVTLRVFEDGRQVKQITVGQHPGSDHAATPAR